MMQSHNIMMCLAKMTVFFKNLVNVGEKIEKGRISVSWLKFQISTFSGVWHHYHV